MCADDQVDTNLNLGIIDITDKIFGGQVPLMKILIIVLLERSNFSSDKTKLKFQSQAFILYILRIN